jgi:hypothetical protein
MTDTIDGYAHEAIGSFSHDHKVLRLQRIIDKSLTEIDEALQPLTGDAELIGRDWNNHLKSVKTVKEAFNLMAEMVKAEFDAKTGKVGITIEIPGLDPSKFIFGGQKCMEKPDVPEAKEDPIDDDMW